MNRNLKSWKFWVQVALAVVLVIDAALIIANWRTTLAAADAQRKEVARLAEQSRLLQADVARNQAIRVHLPEIRKNAEKFYAQQFLPASVGYSSVVQDLGELSAHAGVKTGGVSFGQRELEKRGVYEIKITASVEGDYASLIHFINGLERSKNLYLLDHLSLGTASSGGIKLELELRTFFRA